MNFSSLLLMASGGKDQNPITSLIPFVLIIVIFYFFMIRPQSKKAKETKKFRESLEKGMKIITLGGIHGKIVEMQETTVTIEIESGARMRVEKSAIINDPSMLEKQA